jgi:hypothetical protein
MGIREIPFFPIFPTYDWYGWRMSSEQIRLFFDKALELGCPAVGGWDLSQASSMQVKAIKDYDWPDGLVPSPKDRILEEADALEGSAAALRRITLDL